MDSSLKAEIVNRAYDVDAVAVLFAGNSFGACLQAKYIFYQSNVFHYRGGFKIREYRYYSDELRSSLYAYEHDCFTVVTRKQLDPKIALRAVLTCVKTFHIPLNGENLSGELEGLTHSLKAGVEKEAVDLGA
jgi:Zn-finger domain-containing protein